MDFTLLTRENTAIAYSPVIPPSLARFRIPGAKQSFAAGNFGSLLFYEQSGPGFSLWHKSYFIKQNTPLTAVTDAPLFQLWVAVNRPLRFQQPGMGKTKLAEGQFNIWFTPAGNCQTWFEKSKKYLVYEVHLDRSFLEQLAPHFPPLSDFLVKSSAGMPGQLSPVHAHVTPELMNLLQKMHYCRYTGEVKEMYLQTLLTKLLLLALSRLSLAPIQLNEVKLQPFEMAKLREARDYLLNHLEHTGTVNELAHAIGMNEARLKKGFSQLYGTTIFELLVEARMEKARRLLQESDMTVHAVAISIGYKNISSFTVAFKKKFGLLPSEMQGNGRLQGPES